MDQRVPISEALNSFSQISLDKMDNVRLMNRTDTKYLLSVKRIPDLLIKMNGNYAILDINGSRIFSYHTTYLDTPEYLFFNQHVTGRLSRNKVRFRKYESTGTTFLEVKKKTNKMRTIKWRIENNLLPDGTCDSTANDFIQVHVPERPLHLNPVLISIFDRVTFVCKDVNERITLDFNISYSDLSGRNTALQAIAVLEVKKERTINRSAITDMLKESAVYPTGFSKYCIGTACLKTQIRSNMLKPKILMINKIENEYNRPVLAS